MRSLFFALCLFACGPSSIEVTPRPTSAQVEPEIDVIPPSQPTSQIVAPSSKPNKPPVGAMPLGVVIRIDAFLEEDPLAQDAELYVGFLCESSVEGLFIDDGIARGLVYCGIARGKLVLTRARVTEIFSPKSKFWQDLPLNFEE
jgi:hypothetical protein